MGDPQLERIPIPAVRTLNQTRRFTGHPVEPDNEIFTDPKEQLMAMSCNDYRLTRRRMLAATGASMLGMSVQQLLAAQGSSHAATAEHVILTIELKVPALNDRKEDIELLVNYYLNSGREISNQKSFSPGALRCLVDYNWPGNLLELQSVVERAYILADSMIVEKIHLSDAIHNRSGHAEEEVEDLDYQFIEMPLGELEKFSYLPNIRPFGWE